jgi:prepilin-type N-terminal cleavage/methylation domain-containing protein
MRKVKLFKKLNSVFHEVEKGFTLIELLLSISLLAISVGISSDIIVTLVRTYGKAQVFNDTEQAANFVFQKIQNDIKNSVDVAVLDPGIGKSLILYKKEGSTVTYTVTTPASPALPQIERRINTGNAVPLLDITSVIGGISLSCSGVCFEVINSNPATVGVNFTFSQSSGAGIFNTSVSMEDAFVVRGTY